MDNEEIFGEKAKEYERSPEDLSDYIHVSSPGIWILIIGMIVLFAGALIWALFGHIDKTISAYAYSEKGKLVCFVDQSCYGAVAEGQTVKIGEKEGRIVSAVMGNDGGVVCDIDFPYKLPDGVYTADIFIERVKPISLITN